MRLFYILLPLCVACGAPDNDPRFNVYQDAFNADAREHGIAMQRISVSFDEELPFSMRAVCRDSSYILINEKHWRAMREVDRLRLIYHELGHCQLNLSHDDGVSLMSEVFKRAKKSGKSFDEEALELFTVAKEKQRTSP